MMRSRGLRAFLEQVVHNCLAIVPIVRPELGLGRITGDVKIDISSQLACRQRPKARCQIKGIDRPPTVPASFAESACWNAVQLNLPEASSSPMF